MREPALSAKIKKRAHRAVAFAQDVLVAAAYDALPGPVLHGGTAIWRCYGGTRFSEDVDVYEPGYTPQGGTRLRQGLAAKGARELKFKATASTVFGKFELAGAQVSFEATIRPPPGRLVMPYETLGGGTMLVATLPAEELLAEKAAAYVARRKVRDLYDVLFLLGKAEDRKRAAAPLRRLAAAYEPPVDAAQLKAIVLAGTVPEPEEMIEAVRRWARRYT